MLPVVSSSIEPLGRSPGPSTNSPDMRLLGLLDMWLSIEAAPRCGEAVRARPRPPSRETAGVRRPPHRPEPCCRAMPGLRSKSAISGDASEDRGYAEHDKHSNKLHDDSPTLTSPDLHKMVPRRGHRRRGRGAANRELALHDLEGGVTVRRWRFRRLAIPLRRQLPTLGRLSTFADSSTTSDRCC
jgi:hypothetical protein